MQYIATISSAGQITIPVKLRKFLGVDCGDVITINTTNETATIARKKDIREVLADLDKKQTTAVKAAIKQNKGKTASELKNEWFDSPEGQKYLGEKYDA
jgi:bifunctional DNA-binding transcriptional regulator/antitoxin component of YhaV-PrlF toxin-antitoxin module